MKRNYFIGKKAAMCGTAVLLCMEISAAGDENQKQLKLEIEQVSLFKNGLGFVVSNAVIPDNAVSFRIGQLPIPTLGTFWIGYNANEIKLLNCVTSMENQEVTKNVRTIGQLLKANTGQAVIVHTNDRDIEGTVFAETVKDPAGSGTSTYSMNARIPNTMYNSSAEEISSSDLILIKTAKGIVAVNPASILRAEFPDGNPVQTIYGSVKCPSISLNLERPASGEKLSVSYLARGVMWFPSYRIDLSDPQIAKFSAHALVINEMADFKNVTLQLVTGFPNIQFSEIVNPISKSQNLAEFIVSLSGGRNERAGNLMTQQALMSNHISLREYESTGDLAYAAVKEGQGAEDLFFYPVKSFTLLKDETAWIPLFTAEMPYKHIYTWNIGDYIIEDRQNVQRDQKAAEEIWHSCRLKNTLNMPLTTAAAEFISRGEFVGQDMCSYTAPKSETTIRINKALNVIAEQAETEIDRKRDAVTIHGYQYDLVKVRGELRIRNKADKAILVEILKELSGEVSESSPKAEDRKTAKGLRQINPKHVLTWDINLKKGEEQKIMYQYQVYVRE